MLLFVLHVEANLNSQRHNNAYLTTIVSFLKEYFSLGHIVQQAGSSGPITYIIYPFGIITLTGFITFTTLLIIINLNIYK